MDYYDVEIDGVRRRVAAARARGRLWFHWRGETFVVDLRADQARRSGGGPAVATGRINAPMPGKVTRVGVSVGDVVTKGQVLVVMEAMKMEYTLEADVPGRVVEVGAVEGGQVGLGETLVRVEGA